MEPDGPTPAVPACVPADDKYSCRHAQRGLRWTPQLGRTTKRHAGAGAERAAMVRVSDQRVAAWRSATREIARLGGLVRCRVRRLRSGLWRVRLVDRLRRGTPRPRLGRPLTRAGISARLNGHLRARGALQPNKPGVLYSCLVRSLTRLRSPIQAYPFSSSQTQGTGAFAEGSMTRGSAALCVLLTPQALTIGECRRRRRPQPGK
jgi:hypothetical protein